MGDFVIPVYVSFKPATGNVSDWGLRCILL